MKKDRTTMVLGAGGASAAVASALCCLGPLLAVIAGVSGAGLTTGLAAAIEPLRPYLLMATAGFLLVGFWTVDREERKACQPGRPCAEPRVRRRMKIMLWVATGVAVAGATFPRWQTLVL